MFLDCDALSSESKPLGTHLCTWQESDVALCAQNSNPDSPNAMSRALELGQLLCVLPRTCYNAFGNSQPAYLQSEVDRAEGGWFGIKDQTTQ